jgi:L-arabinonolactonase
MQIEIVADVKTALGESPLWDVDEQRLYWIDSFGQRVFRCTADGDELRAWDVPQPIGSIALRRDGGAIVALARGLHFLDLVTGHVELIVDPEPDRTNNRLNDGKVDRQGRFVVGAMDTTEREQSAGLYRLDADLTLHRLDSGIIVSNGPCWSPDGRTMYFADSWSGEIRAYDYNVASGGVANRRQFAKVETTDGAPDGATVDSEGFVWSAQFFDGLVVRYAPDGTIDRRIEMPVKKVTSVMFGGPGLDVLYATSMARKAFDHWPDDPIARGSLFAITGLGVRGLPETRFGG